MPLSAEKIPYPHPLARKILRGKFFVRERAKKTGRRGLAFSGRRMEGNDQDVKGTMVVFPWRGRRFNLSTSCNLLKLSSSGMSESRMD